MEPPRTRCVGEPMERLTPRNIAIAAAVLLLALVAYFAWGRDGNQDRLSEQEARELAASDPQERCGSQATYDRIRDEIFRRAAAARGSDLAAFDQLAGYSSVRMERPVLEAYDEEVGIARCSGYFSLDLPPGVAVVGGRRVLASQIDYAVQAAADGSGEVVTISNAEAIVTPLATLARIAPPPEAEPDESNAVMTDLEDLLSGIGEERAPPEERAADPPQPAAPTAASPSFDCRNARTRGEIAVCSSPNLAALDRQLAALYTQSVATADGQRRSLLSQTRSRFLSFRDACRSDRCVADAYRGRMREISDIMAGRWQPPR